MVALQLDTEAQPAVNHTAVKWLFVTATFLGSSLLFLIQPMVARMLLPIAGGSSALWNTAMVFFQVTLLGAYLFSHITTTRLRPRAHTVVQSAVLLAPLFLVLPTRVPEDWILAEGVNVSLWALGTLTVVVGLPFFAVSTSSPTLQRWFSLTGHPDADDPYFLYAAGNVGSVLALVSYPLLVEPLFTLRQQGWLWAGIYAVFVVVSVVAAALIAKQTPAGFTAGPAKAKAEAVPEAPRAVGSRSGSALWRQRATWIGWAAVPSALLLGVTNYITTDLASFPLLWVIPLLCYLFSFVLVFGRDPERLVALAKPVVLIGVAPLAVSIYVGVNWLLVSIVIQIAWFFAAAVLCHGRLAADRPEVERLTEFYVSMSVGGAIGGTLTVLLAPIIFSTVMEYPIAIALVFLIIPMAGSSGLTLPFRLPPLVAVAAIAVAGLCAVFAPSVALLALLAAAFAALFSLSTQQALAVVCGVLLLIPQIVGARDDLHTARTPFGVYSVDDVDGLRRLAVGTTLHGAEDVTTAGRPTATTYYHPEGPLGQIFGNVPPSMNVGVVGLGAGAIAAWSRPGDRYHFFEIDPEMVKIAEDPDLFTFLETSPAELNVEVIDGRVGVTRSDEQFDILVLDAFSSDAVPIHLMTLEAVQAYVEHLRADGLLMFNISNRHFDLEPVLGRLADELDLASASQLYFPADEDLATGAEASKWVVMARSSEALNVALTEPDLWKQPPRGGSLWTDDYSFVLGALGSNHSP